MKKSHWILLCIPWLMSSCFVFQKEVIIEVEVESVSLNWDHAIQTDIVFAVKNYSNVELSGIDIHFAKHCAVEIIPDIAEFPNPYFDESSPVVAGDTCTVGVRSSSTIGGCTKIEVTQIVVAYGLNKTETLAPEGVVFNKP